MMQLLELDDGEFSHRLTLLPALVVSTEGMAYYAEYCYSIDCR
jgi:hypothetical protein